MTFGPSNPANSNAFQRDFLERVFMEALTPVLAYRLNADQEPFAARIGETLTKTRAGLMVPNLTPLNPTTNTNIDNGLTGTGYGTEQYTLSLQQIAQASLPVNLADDELTIASFLAKNSSNLGVAQASAIDSLSRNTLFNAYMGGNTVITQTLGAPATTVYVDDIRGFTTKMVNGVSTPVSPSNTLGITINGNPYFVSGFAASGLNISSAAITGGISGTLTTTANVSVSDGTIGNRVLASNAPAIVRPNNRPSTHLLTSSDLFTLDVALAATTYLRNNNVFPFKETGYYHAIVDPTTMAQIFRDPSFQLLYRGETLDNPAYKEGYVSRALGMVFFMTTQAFIQPGQISGGFIPVPVPQTVHRPIVCGEGCLIEGVFTPGLNAIRAEARLGSYSNTVDFTNQSAWGIMTERAASYGSYMYIRPPIDRLGQIVTQTSSYIGGFTAPTDSLTNSTVIGTASNADYKRCVVIETA